MFIMLPIVMAAGVLIYFLLRPSVKDNGQLVRIAQNAEDSEQQSASNMIPPGEIKSS